MFHNWNVWCRNKKERFGSTLLKVTELMELVISFIESKNKKPFLSSKYKSQIHQQNCDHRKQNCQLLRKISICIMAKQVKGESGDYENERR